MVIFNISRFSWPSCCKVNWANPVHEKHAGSEHFLWSVWLITYNSQNLAWNCTISGTYSQEVGFLLWAAWHCFVFCDNHDNRGVWSDSDCLQIRVKAKGSHPLGMLTGDINLGHNWPWSAINGKLELVFLDVAASDDKICVATDHGISCLNVGGLTSQNRR